MSNLESVEDRSRPAQRIGVNEFEPADLAVTDPSESVRSDAATLLESLFLPNAVSVSGRVCDLASGLVTTSVDCANSHVTDPTHRHAEPTMEESRS
jgi:hypothetical protein